MALTVVRAVTEKHNIRYDQIGRIDVGTETPIDQSTFLQSFIMRLFEEHGNISIESTDVYNACYGCTAASLNNVSWMQSRA
jgi:hydroxymethylglutaryl-CoA synthase